MTAFDLTRFLPYQLAAAAERVSRDFAETYRREFDISIPEWRVLAHLNQSGEVSVRDIENRVAMDKSKVSRAASRLEQAGYVVKRVNMGDRRLVVLSLTGRGRDLMERIIPRALAYQAALMERLGPAAPLMAGALATIIEGEKP
ncbi:MAG: winged helix-turn-helix transcriptional regulator [Proteobacteria bacterium]|nr:winged helix-turn-helix transcriptional regulator [Pseudomonadota bacterium]